MTAHLFYKDELQCMKIFVMIFDSHKLNLVKLIHDQQTYCPKVKTLRLDQLYEKQIKSPLPCCIEQLVADVETNQKLDKDVFRRDLGSLTDAYSEVARRLGILPKNGGSTGPKLVE